MIEIVTYNPNYKMIILTEVSFECPNSGIVTPSSSSRAIKMNHYDLAYSLEDRFRAVLEIIFVIFILIQDFKRLKTFSHIWRVTYFKVSHLHTL